MKRNALKWWSGGAVFFIGLFSAVPALAHVKWFVDTEDIVAQETLHYSWNSSFVLFWIGIIVLTLVVAFLLDLLIPAPPEKFLKKIEDWKEQAYRVFAIVIGLNFLIEAYLGSVIAPPFHAENGLAFLLVGFQIFLGLMLMIGWKNRYAAVGIVVLYFGAMVVYGFGPLLDEIFMLGVAAYLFLESPKHDRWTDWAQKYKGYGISLLRVLTGIALIVLAFSEKFLHPELGLNFLNEYSWNFMQMLGVHDFSNVMFVFSAGAMELLFGTILLFGFIPRINMAVTAVFFSITFFLLGPIEVIGHMPIFVTALVIILYGGGEKLNLQNILPFKKRG